MALHVDDRIAKIAATDEIPHASRGVSEQSVVPNRQLELPSLRQLEQLLRVSRVEREGLLYVDVTPMLEAATGNLEMALRRGGDVHDVRRGISQELAQVV